MEIYFILGTPIIIYYLVLTKLQYDTITETKAASVKSKKTHNELHETLPFEQQQLQYNLQGNIFNMPAVFVAMLIYKLRHGKE
ncbi:DUF3949 domain-containing protein [Virgibacillus sp. MG-45]|uniref:DUF3949 domain-containing protein n=1 Tax=Virgibacillus sp. MG-45 TaxID=3102791 RepID=UPI002ED8EBDC